MNVISNLSLLCWFLDSMGNVDPAVDLKVQGMTQPREESHSRRESLSPTGFSLFLRVSTEVNR